MLKNKYGRALVDIAIRGLPSLVGIEGSITFGAPEIFDIAAIPLVKGSIANIKLLLTKEGIDWHEFIRRNAPPVVKHIAGFNPKTIFGQPRISIDYIRRLPPEIRERALELYREMPRHMSEHEKALYALGFSTVTPAEFYQCVYAIKNASAKIREQKAGIHREIAKALQERRDEDMRKILMDAQRRGIRINATAIMRQLGIYKEGEEWEEGWTEEE